MRGIRRVVMVGLLSTVCVGGMAAQSGYDLFQQALVKERSDGQIQQAIALYQRIARAYASDGALASKALLQLGKAYEVLGSNQARGAYERILRDYPDQREVVTEARSRLAALPTAADSDSALVERRVWDHSRDAYFAGGMSADGRYLSYVDEDNGAVMLRDLVRDTSLLVAPSPQDLAYASAVSPDGRYVAYSLSDTAARGDAIRLKDMRGGGDRLLYRSDAIQAAWPKAFSRDGKWILAQLVRRDRINQIAMIRVSNGSARILKSLDWRPAELRMELSPDGRWIAYSFPPVAQSRKSDVYLLATDGSRQVTVVEHPADDFVLGWTPDGRRLVVSSDRTGEPSVWALAVTDGRVRSPLALVRPSVEGWPLGITTQGDYYYGQYSGWSDVFVAELDPASGRVVSQPLQAIQRYEGENHSPEWSPDGSRLIVQSDRPRSTTALVIRSLATGELREINTRQKLNFHFLSWAPAENAVLAIGSDDKGQYGHVLRIDLATGRTVSIAPPDPDGGNWQPDWSPDGRSLVFERTGPAGPRIVRRLVATGEETELYHGGRVYWLRVSPNGTEVAFVQGPSPVALAGDTVKIVNVESHAVRTVVAPGKPVRALDWSPDGKYLLYGVVTDSATEMTRLMRVAVASGEVQQLDVAMPMLTHLKVNPDGRHVAFTAKIRDERVEVWAIERLFAPRGTARQSRSSR